MKATTRLRADGPLKAKPKGDATDAWWYSDRRGIDVLIERAPGETALQCRITLAELRRALVCRPT